jgi:hypothetical protein
MLTKRQIERQSASQIEKRHIDRKRKNKLTEMKEKKKKNFI